MLQKWQNRKNTILFLFFSVILLGVLWAILIWNELRIVEFDTDQVSVVSLEDGYRGYLETVHYKEDDNAITDDFIMLSGWLIKPGEDIQAASIKIVLKNEDTSQYYLIPTMMDVREDVTGYFSDGCNYHHSGFEMKIPYEGKIQTDLYDYGIYALYTRNEDNTRLISFDTTFRTWENHE